MIRTTSLEISKGLKDAGFRQDTFFWWARRRNPITKGYYDHDLFCMEESNQIERFSAPTIDDLLDEINNNQILQYNDDLYPLTPVGHLMDLYRSPDKLAECWLWLKKEGLIK